MAGNLILHLFKFRRTEDSVRFQTKADENLSDFEEADRVGVKSQILQNIFHIFLTPIPKNYKSAGAKKRPTQISSSGSS
jgi:hypothetical protein